MNTYAKLVWPDGFPSGVQLIADEEYQLAVEKLEVTMTASYATICLVFVCDGEYILWRDVYEEANFIDAFARSLGGAVEWREYILVWTSFLGENLSQADKETLLLERLMKFLLVSGIELPAQTSPPHVEWQGRAA